VTVEITAALTKEQGVRFVVVLVKQQAIQPATRDATTRSVSSLFPGELVVLCAQDSQGTPTYYGRPDIVKFLANIDIRQLPWKRYRTAAA
jgi:hypothetical protein